MFYNLISKIKIKYYNSNSLNKKYQINLFLTDIILNLYKFLKINLLTLIFYLWWELR